MKKLRFFMALVAMVTAGPGILNARSAELLEMLYNFQEGFSRGIKWEVDTGYGIKNEKLIGRYDNMEVERNKVQQRFDCDMWRGFLKMKLQNAPNPVNNDYLILISRKEL